MEIVEFTLGLLLAIAVVGAIGKWVAIPLPILQVAAGVTLSFLPGFRSLHVPPELFFLLFIPPLLFADGWLIPKRELLGVLLPVLTRVTTIVGGESLINDASGLIAFKFATLAVVAGAFSWREAAADFFLLSGGGFLLGVAIAWICGKLRQQLVRFCVDDTT